MKKLIIVISLLFIPILAHAIIVGMGNTVTSSGFTAFTDNFTGSNGAALNSTHWASSAYATIQGNQARITSAHTIQGIEDITLQATHSVSAKIWSVDDAANNGHNHTSISIQNAASVGTGNNRVIASIDTYCADWDDDFEECNSTATKYYLESISSVGAGTTHISGDCAQGDTLEIRFTALDQVNIYKNGAKMGGPYTTTSTLGSTQRVSMICDGTSSPASNYIDDFVLQVL